MAEKSRPTSRRRAAPSRKLGPSQKSSRLPRRGKHDPAGFTSPLEEGGKGGGGGGVEDTTCPGRDEYHSHHHHPTPAGLIQHLRITFSMLMARKLVDKYGYDLVVGVLDELTEIYGPLLDRPKPGPEPAYDFYAGRPAPVPEINNPAGFIYRMVQEAAVEMEQSADDLVNES